MLAEDKVEQKVREIGKDPEPKKPFVVSEYEYKENGEPKKCVKFRIVGDPDPPPPPPSPPSPPPPPRIKGFAPKERTAFIQNMEKHGIKTMEHPDVISRGVFRRVRQVSKKKETNSDEAKAE